MTTIESKYYIVTNIVFDIGMLSVCVVNHKLIQLVINYINVLCTYLITLTIRSYVTES